MYAMLGVFAILFVAALVQTFSNYPVIDRVRNGLDELFTGKGYLRYFGLTAVFAAVGYGLGIITIGPFLGVYEAAIQVGTLYVVAFFLGLVMCFGSFTRDVGDVTHSAFTGTKRKSRPGASILFGVVFTTALWGCGMLLTFYDHSVSGALVSVSVGH